MKGKEEMENDKWKRETMKGKEKMENDK